MTRRPAPNAPESPFAWPVTLPLIIAFVILAAYTYLAGLRAPALIAFVKDALVYATVIVAILYIPARLGGWGHIFGAASAHLKSVNPQTGKPYGSLIVAPAGEWAYATLAVNLVVATAGTLLFRVTGVPNGHDETRPEHSTADPEGPPAAQAAGIPAPAATAVPAPTASATGARGLPRPRRPRAPE